MTDAKTEHDGAEPGPVEPVETGENEFAHSGVLRELGELPQGAIITEAGLAMMLGKHPQSIKRAVERGELPEPCRFMGKSSWLAGTIVKHFERRLEDAAKERKKEDARIRRFSP